MEIRSREFPARARHTLRTAPRLREAVMGATGTFDGNRRRAYAELDIEAWRAWAGAVKGHLLTRLDHYLEQAERTLLANGVQVHWAESATDVSQILAELSERHGVRRVVKGKSMVSEEMGVNEALQARGVEVFETDLGEYIIQLLQEPPSHIIGPAIHRSLADVQALFHRVHGTPRDAGPPVLAAAAREVLRDAFLTAEMGITGGNFIVAETGTLVLIENEGNIRLTTSAPRVHVALVGIEKLLPRWTDLAGFLQLIARAATGQRIGTFVSLLHGPRGPDDVDGPEEMHVVFVDNGRSALLADPEAWEALRCIRCGACLNVCPVYRQTGGHAYGWVYSGPIGAILAPGLVGLDEAMPLPFASSLCGACSEVCPVRIPIPELLLTWRRRAAKRGLTPSSEGRALRAFTAIASRPRLWRVTSWLSRRLARPGSWLLPAARAWRGVRAPLRPSRLSFLRLWTRRGGRVEREPPS